jgi:hypothetical protein
MNPNNTDQHTTEKVNNIVTNFHSIISKVMKICKKIEPNSIELETVQRLIGLARDIDPLMIINRCKDKFWMHRQQILNEDEEFFLNNQFSDFIKEDENKSFIYNLMNLIKLRYREMSKAEKKQIWTHIKDLLKCIIEYKTAINDFAQ